MNFKDGVPVVISKRVSTFFGFFLFDIRVKRFWFPKVYFSIEPISLKLNHFVLGLAHYVSYTLCGFDIRGTVGHNYVFSRYVDRHLAPQIGVKIDLFEG